MIDVHILSLLQILLAVVFITLMLLGSRLSRGASTLHPLMFAGFVGVALHCLVIIWKFVGRPLADPADIRMVTITGAVLVLLLLALTARKRRTEGVAVASGHLW